jgi:glutamate racemase
MINQIKVGVFDSGVGALSVINAIKKEMPDLEIVYKDDKEHVPYGTREIEEIHKFIRPMFRQFMDEGCQVIVVPHRGHWVAKDMNGLSKSMAKESKS